MTDPWQDLEALDDTLLPSVEDTDSLPDDLGTDYGLPESTPEEE